MDICHFVCKTFNDGWYMLRCILNIDVKIEELPVEVYTAGTQFAVSVLVYPLVMAIVIHFYLPVYDQLRLTTSYQYLQLRNQDTSTFCTLSSDYSYGLLVCGHHQYHWFLCKFLSRFTVSFCQHVTFPKCKLNRNASEYFYTN